ncbi:MAG: MarR family transcriptional regulator [Rickettsiales bacterium]|jgi:DNA-binding MarR family transcriptional regulator|nr:MarR family transcriptional regulator [Rickettsiales bacterium]
MAHKKLAQLLLQNVASLSRLAGDIRGGAPVNMKSKQHFEVMVRLKLDGRTMLKDMAARSHMSAANISTTIKNLEADGLVRREQDKADRRNVWYSLTKSGEKSAEAAVEKFLGNITKFFARLPERDETRFVSALMDVNEILKKIEENDDE